MIKSIDCTSVKETVIETFDNRDEWSVLKSVTVEVEPCINLVEFWHYTVRHIISLFYITILVSSHYSSSSYETCTLSSLMIYTTSSTIVIKLLLQS